MRKLLVAAMSIAMVLPTVSQADGGPPPRPPGGNHGSPAYHGGDWNHGGGDRDDHHYGGRDEHHYGPPHGPVYRPPHAYPRYYPPVRYYPARPYYGHAPAPYYHGGGHHHGSDNDDALWAIGGLIVGAVIGTAVQKQEQAKQNSSVPAGPPSGCRDTVVYDSDGTPRVQRDCN